MSKERLLTESNTSLAVMLSLARMACAAFTTLRCAICTPFGQPADPEVYIT